MVRNKINILFDMEYQFDDVNSLCNEIMNTVILNSERRKDVIDNLCESIIDYNRLKNELHTLCDMETVCFNLEEMNTYEELIYEWLDELSL